MYRFVTDSMSGLSPQSAPHFGVDAVVASVVRFGEDIYRENVDITPDEFHAKMKTDARFPTTAAPSIAEFEDVFKEYAGNTVICINVSRDLSGTVTAAENAANALGGDIHVIDSRSISAAQLLLLREAQRMAQEGKSGPQIKTELEQIVPKLKLHVMLDTLENLKRGGRIGGAQAMIGSLLSMKPLLTLREGKLQPLERVRTYSKAVQRLKEIVSTDVKGKTKINLAVLHAHSPGPAETLASEFVTELALPAKPLIIEVGAAVAAHVGPGAVGVAYFT